MAAVIEKVAKAFAEREAKVLDLIQKSGISYEEVGIFGSYARDNYTGRSDIDFCIITDHRPDRRTSGVLREEADMLGADIIYVTRESFEKGDSFFSRNLRRDYRRVL